ncbi:Xaa-Pro peptidase family protein [Paenibacillus alkaliterrae]|uniref:M24 family metallopeptidase n=1 Tax=Paenibacillus alkaliterrae TaxID=320909 RepID=UPI001F467753|nr:Xaa-Pro peptidase family protein [Paenibacillus alkaliterrae]MCF2939064.1 Xaa-Pro peptidase family protein [Paenibacillus alkaliterrae]
MDIKPDIPTELVRQRIERLQKVMQSESMDAFILTQNIDIYYFSGSMQNGFLFIPCIGEATFYVRRSIQRAKLETPVQVAELGAFRQFGQTLRTDYPSLGREGAKLRIAADLDVLPAQIYLKLSELLSSARLCELVDGSAHIRKLRMIKAAWEIGRIESAARVVAEALEESLNELKEGISELAWMARVEYELRVRGHIGMMRLRGYNQEITTGMVISGAAAAVPTYFDGPAGGLGLGAASPQSVSRSTIHRDVPILIDIGCCIDGYVIDQTRTAVIGELPEALMRAYEVSESIIVAAESQMIPGAICTKIYEDALQQCAAAQLSDHFMGYGADQAKFLGHGIGLEIDEWPVLAKGFNMPLEEGMVIAVEPKFTFPGQGVVGIENSYLITEHGARALTFTKTGLIVLP